LEGTPLAEYVPIWPPVYGTEEQGATIAGNLVLRNVGVPITWGFLVCSVLVYCRKTMPVRRPPVLRPGS